MKLQNCVFIAIASAIALTSGFTEAKRDRRDIVEAQTDFNRDNSADIADPDELWKHHKHNKHHKHHKHHGKQHGKHHHHGKHHGKHHGNHKKCKTQTVVVFAPCTSDNGGDASRSDRPQPTYSSGKPIPTGSGKPQPTYSSGKPIPTGS
ncbi:hypothetical protein BGZ83_001080, partial [Gryganskiella cystojenkinii]